MPQEFLPFFAASGEGYITELLSYEKRNGSVYYFHAGLPIFSHPEDDKNSFRMFTSQLVVEGNCKQVDIVKAFGVSPISVKRWVKTYRTEGVKGFFKSPASRGAHVMTPEVLTQAQQWLNEGMSRIEVADRLGIKSDTLYRAIRAGKLQEPVKKTMR